MRVEVDQADIQNRNTVDRFYHYVFWSLKRSETAYCSVLLRLIFACCPLMEVLSYSIQFTRFLFTAIMYIEFCQHFD